MITLWPAVWVMEAPPWENTTSMIHQLPESVDLAYWHHLYV